MEMDKNNKGEGHNDNNHDQGQNIDQELVKVPEQEIVEVRKPVDTGKPEPAEPEEHKDKKKPKKISEKEFDSLKHENAELKDKYLRLYSEFENFRRRTSKEKLDLINTAGEGLLVALLPVLDDFERAIKVMAEGENADKSQLEGIRLIYNKLKYIGEQKGLRVMEISQGADFNEEWHEAISQIPVEDEKLKGKVVEVMEKGYYLHNKVIRFAKVITGSY